MSRTEVDIARDCYERRRWREAHRRLADADRRSGLCVADLERLATAAYLIGRDLEFLSCLERAHRGHLRKGDQRSAARAAFWLGMMLLLRGESAQATGWLGRAQRMLEQEDCVEQGYLLLPAAERNLGANDVDAALEAAERAVAIGERFGDGDLTACARHLQGRALIRRGDLGDGLGLLDEVMIAVSRGELSPIVTGLVYCSVIEACQQVFALSRAREWTVALGRWCEQQPEMLAFTGACMIRRAEVLRFRGAWEEALMEAAQALDRISRSGEREPPAAAFYEQGEIHRLRGELAAAEEAYREASRLGCDPQPGLALLRLDEGATEAACAAIRRALHLAVDPLARARLLPACIEIMLAAGERTAAREAAAELDEISRRYPTDVLEAMAAQSRGAVELADGHADVAVGHLRRAFELWLASDAPYEAARVRVLLAVACRALGDRDSAELEFDAAATVFAELGAAPEIARLGTLRRAPGSARRPHLTPRELQVLRLIAGGKTNRAIASELFVSERTVDRHVSNILTKLGVPSRAAATAYAYEHELLC